ncbi:hypothetical protein I9W82_003500 [Candida metapsilosis]|uniref:Survival protein SurE-like phosphatase/nucleotidase domain-containing protein n=1 Tax=Candida metapsilosis TaxID=273372 RepID=A0A8H7ZBG9_9ASCO|nr:hypothetical protein I9W82_003500 [Candida metapsilosis]
MRLTISILIFQSIIATTLSLNILLTSTDSWTSKNVRFLQYHLQQQGHNVVLMAPLYQQNANLELPNKLTQGLKSIKDGGEYGHLLPVHQNYYSKINKQNMKRAKQVVFEADVIKEEEEDIVLNNQYGQDPSNHDAWYINCDATNALTIAMNLLIPKFYPDFELDLVIIGPNGGPYHSSLITSMVRQVQIDKVDAIAVSTQDYHQVYFQDEKFFKISSTDVDFQLSKSNVHTKNIKLIDKHVVSLVDKLAQKRNENAVKENGRALGLHLQFPSLNFRDSYCQTSPTTQLDYQVIPRNRKRDRQHNRQDTTTSSFDYEMDLDGKIIRVEEDNEESSRGYASFRLKDDEATLSNGLGQQRKRNKHNLESRATVDKEQESTDYVLSNCNIAVTTIGHANRKLLKKLIASD